MITEHDDDQIDRYLNGRLDAAAAEAFEIRMLEEPELLERVQLVDAMKAGLKHQAPQLQIAASKPGNVAAFTGWLRQPLSLAASVLLAVLFLRELFPSEAGNTSTAIGTVVLLENSRGTDAATFTGPPPYLLQLDAGLGNTADNFAVVVRDGGNATVTQLSGLQADRDGWVRLLVSEALSGNYQVELAWTDAQGSAQNRQFQLQVNP